MWTKRIMWLATYQIRPKFWLEHDQTRLYDLINVTPIYDKASSTTQLLTNDATANVFRRLFVPKGDILNIQA